MRQRIDVISSYGNESLAILRMYQGWDKKLLLQTTAFIGKNGVGKSYEGDGKTPEGIYRFLFAFGSKPKPKTSFPYIQIHQNHYWVDDSDSVYYNQLVNIKDVRKDWSSAEHMMEHLPSYHYGLVLDYNKECIPGKGSAVFLHCLPTEGAGCIAVSEEEMYFILEKIEIDCRIGIYEKNKMERGKKCTYFYLP